MRDFLGAVRLARERLEKKGASLRSQSPEELHNDHGQPISPLFLAAWDVRQCIVILDSYQRETEHHADTGLLTLARQLLGAIETRMVVTAPKGGAK